MSTNIGPTLVTFLRTTISTQVQAYLASTPRTTEFTFGVISKCGGMIYTVGYTHCKRKYS